jgi:demethylmenaquinone methyltransferase / 2-methoxy-6-polyprenyl-1,4-benzoquinol methylase
MYRLLRPGGKVCILEFFLPQSKVPRTIYSFYLCRVMPLAARLIAGNAAPWHYLADSIKQWEQVNLRHHLLEAGFGKIANHPLTFNTVQITTAQKTP